MRKILFIIDAIELKYFEFNPLVTDFWLIKEFLKRSDEIFVTTKDKLYISERNPYAVAFKSDLKRENIFYAQTANNISLNEFDVIFFRPDPPVDIDYINACYVLNYVNKTKTIVINAPNSILAKNEKMYVNEFEGIAPSNIVSADFNTIKKFLSEKKEIIIKPLNRCFSSGVFYLKFGDKNTNTIINSSTNNGKTLVMVQKYLPEVSNGDKRIIFIGGEFLDYSVQKTGVDDFKFNEHTLISSNFKASCLTNEEKNLCLKMSDKLMKDGVYIAGLDVINGKVIEINITSPCFFIKEINNLFGINFEDIVMDKIENLIITLKNQKLGGY